MENVIEGEVMPKEEPREVGTIGHNAFGARSGSGRVLAADLRVVPVEAHHANA